MGARTTTRGNHRAYIGADFAVGAPSRLEVGLGWRVRPNARYFGLGPGAGEDAKSFFRHETLWLGASYRRHLGNDFSLTGDVIVSAVEASRPSEDESPSITSVFAANLPAICHCHISAHSLQDVQQAGARRIQQNITYGHL